MADTKLSALTEVTALATTDELYVNDAGVSKRITAANAGTSLATLAAGKQTIWVPAGAMTLRTTNGPSSGSLELATNDVMVKTLDFSGATSEGAQFTVAMPKSWNESTITAQFIWSHAATTTNFGVVFALAGLAVSNDDAMDAAFGTAVSVADTGGTTNDLYITSETAAITIAGTPAELDAVIFQVTRLPADASDTMTVDARLHGVRLYYTANAGNDN